MDRVSLDWICHNPFLEQEKDGAVKLLKLARQQSFGNSKDVGVKLIVDDNTMETWTNNTKLLGKVKTTFQKHRSYHLYQGTEDAYLGVMGKKRKGLEDDELAKDFSTFINEWKRDGKSLQLLNVHIFFAV